MTNDNHSRTIAPTGDGADTPLTPIHFKKPVRQPVHYRFPWLLLLSIFRLFPAHGQQLHLKHFTVDDGLPSNEIYQVLQDTSGNLMIATDRGAVRYDGYTFTDIPHQNKLTSKPVYYVYRSPTGSIYFSSLQGIIYQHENDTLYSYRHNEKAARLFQHPGVLIANSISANNDTLWISFNNDYNYNYKVGTCFLTNDGQVKKIEKPDGIYFDMPRSFYYRQLSLPGLSQTKQPVYITWKNGEVTKDEADLSWQSGYIRRLFYRHCGDYDLFSIGRKLLVYKNKKRVSSFLFPENVLSLTTAGDNRIYVGFENKGFAIYQLQQGILQSPVEQHLQGYSVSCIYQDNQQGFWFSTLENGLFYRHPSQTRYLESSSRIVSITNKKDSVFSGDNSGLVQVFRAGQVVDSFRVPLSPAGTLLQLSFDRNGSLIALTNKGFYTRQNKEWLFQPAQDIRLLSAGNDLLYSATGSTAQLHVYKDRKLLQKLQLSKRIFSLFTTATQELWMGTWEGLLKYENGQLVDYSEKSPVFNDRIVAIDELSGGYLVVASLGHGVAVYKKGITYLLNSSNGLPSRIINSMMVHDGDIWIGTNKGLTRARFEKDSFRVVHFGREAGLPSVDINQFTVNNGWLYLKWFNRLAVISINNLLKTDQNTRTVLTSVMVSDKSGTYKAVAQLGHKQNALTFHFTCTNLSSAYQQEYSYTLEGFDKRWHRTRERYAKYTNLPPGRYTFKVQAINLQDNTPSALAMHTFFIQPAFWQQWWFFIFCAWLLFLLIWFGFHLRLNAIKKKNSLLLELAENRQKALVQLIHPHFVFNVLNTIQGAVLKQDKMVAATLIAKFAKLMRLSMELSKEKWVSLEKETELLKKYFELEEIRSPGRFAYHIEAIQPVLTARIQIPSMLIQPFVENAIKHGVMHLAGRTGYIRIQFSREQDELICMVDDNGIGRQQSERINKNKREQHQSSGIEITINRLRLLHREQDTPFRYEIIDKQDSQGEPIGTTIKFSLPYKEVYEPDPSYRH